MNILDHVPILNVCLMAQSIQMDRLGLFLTIFQFCAIIET